GAGATAYYFLSEPEVRYVSRTETPENLSPFIRSESNTAQTNIGDEQTNLKDKQSAVRGEQKTAQKDHTPSQSNQTQVSEKAKSTAISRKSSGADKPVISNNEIQQSAKNTGRENPEMPHADKSAEMAMVGQRIADVRNLKPGAVNDENDISAKPDVLSDGRDNGNAGELPGPSLDKQSSASLSPPASASNPANESNPADKSNSVDAADVFDSASESSWGKLEKLPMLGTNLPAAVSPKLSNEKRKIEPQNYPLFVPFIYFKLEQNNVFSTSPAIGIGLQRNLALPGKGSIAVKAGIGYQRTGRLAWEQNSQTVTYGFDRYVETSNLKTDNLGMVQLPIQLSYQTGVHRIFAGAEINWVVNASQTFRQNAEGPVEEGYIYDSGAPKNTIFWQAGYGYALNEKLQLDLGVNMAGGEWNPAGKRPIGGFIRLNYIIR
ncbi:MAG TPA: hypothetical protein VJ911_05255, partial [Cryomorphaceae bacterium]|nr:hypothetical protein [Cryomorphaceae bacterium]